MLEDFFDTVDTLVGSFDVLLAVFDDDYKGGDQCAGMTFGMQGAQMLEKIAVMLFENHLKAKADLARAHT